MEKAKLVRSIVMALLLSSTLKCCGDMWKKPGYVTVEWNHRPPITYLHAYAHVPVAHCVQISLVMLPSADFILLCHHDIVKFHEVNISLHHTCRSFLFLWADVDMAEVGGCHSGWLPERVGSWSTTGKGKNIGMNWYTCHHKAMICCSDWCHSKDLIVYSASRPKNKLGVYPKMARNPHQWRYYRKHRVQQNPT